MEAKMEVDGDMVGDCFSVARNIEIGTENVCPPSPACSQISESGISVNSERGKGEQLDLQKVISDSIVDTCKVPMRTLRKACPELYRRCYQTKTGKRKVKYSWDPSHKPSDWPNNVRFVDPNNGIKGKDGRFGNKPGRKELEQMFNFLRDKFVMMSKTECEAEQVVVKMEEKFKHFMGASFKKSKTECEAEQVVVKTEEKPLVKSMQVEESVPAPGPSVDMKKITERRDAALDRIKQQANPDPNVQAQLDRIKTELCGQYNRLLANTPDMRSYMKFFSNCRQIEVLADNMDVFGSAFLEQHFEMQSREVLDGLRELRRPAGGGFRQETSMGHAIQVHGVASSADVTAPHRVPTQNQIHIPSNQPVNTEAPPCDEKVECDEKKCLPDMFEKSTPFQNAEKTVAYCLESELRLPLDWDALFGKPGSWCNDVFEKVAGDEEDMKYAVTEEELFDQLQVQVRNVGPQDKADESKSWEKELKLELPATNLSQYQDDIPMMEGVEASSDLPSLTELTTVASPDAQTSWDASLNHSTFGSQSPVAIHAHFVSQSAVATHDVTASGYCQQDYIGGEIPSFVEAFNEPDPDVMMVDTVMSNTYPDLDESFSDLSNFSFDVDKGYDLH